MKIEWKNCLKIGISIFILYLCIYYWKSAAAGLSVLASASMPLILGATIAYVVNILMKFYENHYFRKSSKSIVQKSRRPVCMVAAFLTLAAIIALVIGLVVPQLVSCVRVLISGAPYAMDFLLKTAEKYNIVPENILDSLAGIYWKARIGEMITAVGNGLGSVMDNLVKMLTSIFSGIVSGLIGFIFACYLLLSKDKLKNQINRIMDHYLKEKIVKKIDYVVRIFDDCFHNYIVGQCTEAVSLGALCTVGMLLLRLPYASMIGALVAFTALIPVAGAYIGAAAGAFMILTDSPIKALVFLIFLVILQQIEGNVIYPKVVGSSVGLPAMWVLAAVTVGGGLMGVVGMVFAVPAAAGIYRLICDDINGKGKIFSKKIVDNPKNGSKYENSDKI